jgi:hypothetical protein
MLGFDLAVFEEQIALAPNHFALVMEESLDGPA